MVCYTTLLLGTYHIFIAFLGPVRSTESYHLAFDEALVVIEVGDENDNAPVFEVQGRPIVAAVPLEASFGYQVLRISVSYWIF